MKQSEFEVAELLEEHRSKTGIALAIGTVESATGGGIADRLTDVPGISDYLRASLVSYSNTIKIGFAGVSEQTLSKYGAVSGKTAEEMSAGGRRLFALDICLSDTGIAGPGGATDAKPVGLFYIGLSAYDGTIHRKYLFHGDRRQNKIQAVEAALALLKEYLAERIKKLNGISLSEKHVVTCFLEYEGKILIVRRSDKVGTYRGAWSGISGFLDSDDDLNQAYIEILEETGLGSGDVTLIRCGTQLELIDECLATRWIVHPFLFTISSPEKIRLDWENQGCKWLFPAEIDNYLTVPGLSTAYSRVAG